MRTMTAPKKRTRGRPKGVEQPKKPIASFKGSEAFADWFEALAREQRLTASILIEHALIEYAKSHGFKPPPPER